MNLNIFHESVSNSGTQGSMHLEFCLSLEKKSKLCCLANNIKSCDHLCTTSCSQDSRSGLVWKLSRLSLDYKHTKNRACEIASEVFLMSFFVFNLFLCSRINTWFSHFRSHLKVMTVCSISLQLLSPGSYKL